MPITRPPVPRCRDAAVLAAPRAAVERPRRGDARRDDRALAAVPRRVARHVPLGVRPLREFRQRRQHRACVRPRRRCVDSVRRGPRAWSLVPASAGLVLAVAIAWRVSGHATNAVAVGVAAGVLLAGTTAYAADEDSAPVVAPMPAPLAFRAAVLLGGVAVLAAACWAVVLATSCRSRRTSRSRARR
jgi:hypothetical protein